MRVACEISEAELDGDYCAVEGVCAACSRCGHETESFGTSEASIRRCLVLLREECPNGEHNYYFDAGERRESAAAAAYERGYADGRASASGTAGFNAAQIRALVTLTHPDRHPPERFELANRATAALLGLLSDEERKAA